jgi:hypothetical protein
MSYAARADDVRRQEWPGPARFVHPGWIAAMILGFVLFWPIGLAILGYVIWSRKMGCYRDGDRWQHKMHRMEAKMERLRARMGGGAPTSGNRAFDEYREETLRRLEDEQREFRDFLDRLRFAKDKAEFDQFMAERRNRPSEPPAPYSPQPQG